MVFGFFWHQTYKSTSFFSFFFCPKPITACGCCSFLVPNLQQNKVIVVFVHQTYKNKKVFATFWYQTHKNIVFVFFRHHTYRTAMLSLFFDTKQLAKRMGFCCFSGSLTPNSQNHIVLVVVLAPNLQKHKIFITFWPQTYRTWGSCSFFVPNLQRQVFWSFLTQNLQKHIFEKFFWHQIKKKRKFLLVFGTNPTNKCGFWSFFGGTSRQVRFL